MLEALAALLCCQLMGELIVVGLDLSLPGPVIGMAIMFVGLSIYGRVPDSLSNTSQGLLGQLSLLFVPAGVGIMTHLNLLQAQWLPLMLALVASSLVGLAVTAWMTQWLIRHIEPSANDKGENL